MSTINYLDDYRLYDFFENSDKIIIYRNGVESTFEKNSAEYNDILKEFLYLINYSHEMPAFGVSLHEETKKATEQGVWIKFVFSQEQTHNEMPFNGLLINVEPDFEGFNLIREQQNRYEGRCFYLDLERNNMQDFYNTIIKNVTK